MLSRHLTGSLLEKRNQLATWSVNHTNDFSDMSCCSGFHSIYYHKTTLAFLGREVEPEDMPTRTSICRITPLQTIWQLDRSRLSAIDHVNAHGLKDYNQYCFCLSPHQALGSERFPRKIRTSVLVSNSLFFPLPPLSEFSNQGGDGIIPFLGLLSGRKGFACLPRRL